MPVEEIREKVKELKLTPSDVFSKEELADDPVIVAYVKSKGTDEYWARKRNLEESIKRETKLTEEKAEMQKKLDTSNQEKLKMEATAKFDEFIADRKLDEKQLKFVKSKLPNFVPENGDLKVSANKFLDTTLDEYETTAEMFGVGKKKGDDKTEDNATGADDDDQANDNSKYLDPEKNPFIPQV